MIKSWLNLCLAILTAGSFFGGQAAQGSLISTDPTPGADALSGSYSIVVEGYDWGSAVSGVVLTLEDTVTQVSAEMFSVIEEKQTLEFGDGNAIVRQERTVTAAYPCDKEGNPVDTPSNHVALELKIGPTIGSPLNYDPSVLHYRRAKPYRLVIELTDDSTLIGTTGTSYSRLAIARDTDGQVIPLTNTFRTATYYGQRHTFSYASFAPARDGALHPLIIWLHGLGEGGSDINVPLLGSDIAALAEDSVQNAMNGAYILVPQSPTMWLDDGSGRETTTGYTCYTDDLMALIRQFVYTNPYIDPDRIYIGGCSNGGFMTLDLLLAYPDFFAAAFPVCEAYQDSWLSDEDIQTLSRIPMWFVHSELDQICPPAQSTFPTVERLLACGSDRVRLTRLGEIYDTSGLYPDENGVPYQYNSHCAWVPVLNDQCSDPATGQTLFQWLASQSRTK